MDIWNIAIPIVSASGLAAWGAFHPASQLFGPTLRRLEQGCALTFDDGPNPEVTPRLLSLLDRHAVPATFFVLGKYVREYPQLVREIAARKHRIGNHTYAHPNLLFMSRGQIRDELNRCEDALVSAIGRRSDCVRPPFGFRGPQFESAARQLGFSKPVMWSVNGRDWKAQPAASVSRRLRRARPGDIVLLHDGDHRIPGANRSHMLQALESWLPQSKDSGVEFVTLPLDVKI